MHTLLYKCQLSDNFYRTWSFSGLHTLLYLFCFGFFFHSLAITSRVTRCKLTQGNTLNDSREKSTQRTDTKFILETERVAEWHRSRAKWTKSGGWSEKMGRTVESNISEHIQAFTAAWHGGTLLCSFQKTRKFLWPAAACVSTVTRIQVDYANQVSRYLSVAHSSKVPATLWFNVVVFLLCKKSNRNSFILN